MLKYINDARPHESKVLRTTLSITCVSRQKNRDTVQEVPLWVSQRQAGQAWAL